METSNPTPSSNVFSTGNFHQLLASFSITLGSFGLGTVLGWSAPALPSLTESQDLGDLSKEEISWIASLPILGALLSGPVAGCVLNKLGRRLSLVAFGFPMALGWLLISLSVFHPGLIYIGRFITGFTGGTFTVVIPVYISETIHENLRGRLGSLMVLMLVSGILFAYVCGALMSWVWLSLSCASFPALLCLVTLTYIPETPKFLMTKSKQIEAEKSYRWLRRISDCKPLGKEFESLLPSSPSNECCNDQGEVTEVLAIGRGRSNYATRPHKKRMILKPAFICSTMMILQQLGGINAVSMYTVDIFKSASESIDPHLASVIIGIVQVVFVFLSMILVDKYGRKVLLMSSGLLMAISMFVLAGYFYLKETYDANLLLQFYWIPLITLMAYIVAYSFGLGPVPWLLTSELLNREYKSEVSGFITLTYWLIAFIATKTFRNMTDLLNESGSYFAFAVVCLTASLFTAFVVPETKGKSAEEIEKYFDINDEEAINSDSNKQIDNDLISVHSSSLKQ